ncbi:MAG: hypothetical protein WKG07_27090 [Hymenobacter sp.]
MHPDSHHRGHHDAHLPDLDFYAQRSPGGGQGLRVPRAPTTPTLPHAAAKRSWRRSITASTVWPWPRAWRPSTACCSLLKPGDEVGPTDDLYGGSYRIMTKVYEPLGIKRHFVPMGDPAARCAPKSRPIPS